MKSEVLALERLRTQKEVALELLALLKQPLVGLLASFAILESLRATTFSRECHLKVGRWDIGDVRLADAMEVAVVLPYALSAGEKVGAAAEKLIPAIGTLAKIL